MTGNVLLALVITFSVLASILLILQVVVSLKGKSRTTRRTRPRNDDPRNGGTNYYQIVPEQDISRRLTNAVGTIDESISYSNELSSPNNDVRPTLKISGKGRDINTWWRFVRDPQGTNAYRIQSMLTGMYVSFQKEDEYTENFGVNLFEYITVEEPDIGNPILNGAGWFTFENVGPSTLLPGFRYRIRCVEPEGFNLATALTWEGRSSIQYPHYFYSEDQDNITFFRKPIHPRIVHISNKRSEVFIINVIL